MKDLTLPTPALPPTEREAFETWARDKHWSIRRRPEPAGDFYSDQRTQEGWFGWQARAALSHHEDGGRADTSELEQMRERKDAAYLERNQVVAALAKCFPSGVARTAIEGWSEDWHGCVYIDLPATGPTPGLGGPDREFVMIRRKEPLKGQEIGRFRVSEVDADLVVNTDWYRHDGGYWTRQPHLPGPNGYLHRIIATRVFGVLPETWEVDHIDRDPCNMTRSNLRLATPFGNKLNRSNAGGSVRQRSANSWQALWGTPQVFLGTFATENEARAACATYHASLIAKAHTEGDYIYPPLQCSWHFHDSHAYLFDGLPPYTGTWDGHDTPEKYARLAKLGVALGGEKGEPPCSEHPDAPHGYNRSASHNAGRYVCDCEGWAAMGGEKGEAVAWQWQTEDGQVGFIDPWQKESGWEQANPRAKLIRPLFAAPVGKARMLTDEEADHITGMHNTGRSQGDSECAEAIQRKFCEVNGIELQDVQRGSKTFPENNVSKD